MSTVDTSTWSPDTDLNVEIEGIPLNADASIAQTWQAIRVLMAALKTAMTNVTLETASRAVVTDADKKLAVSSVTSTELGYLSGVTSAVQTQLDAKAADSGVVHKSGDETIAGDKTFSGTIAVNKITSRTKTSLAFDSYGDSTKGAYLTLFTEDHSSRPGYVRIVSRTSSASKVLEARPDGTLTWDGQALQTSSDERMKTPLLAVPDAVLDAWGDVQWGQFCYLDAVERKGDAARQHLGLIAQKVKSAFEARDLDACAYGILCYDEADGFWSVRYAEALAMEAAFQRCRADRLEKRLSEMDARLVAMEVRYA